MNKPSHTPGPWTINQAFCPDRNEWVLEIQGENDFVADVKIKRTEVAAANAHLIAASPDGHDILLLLKRFIDSGANQISLGALMDTDDETTLAQAIERYFTKVTGGAE
jgi:hypothetical protein